MGEVGSERWWAEWHERAARRRPRPDGLTIDRIISAALRIIDDDGLDALTVRRLAHDLGTGSASLYRHLAGREELLVLVVDHVLGEIVLPDPAEPPSTRVVLLTHELRRVLLAHPHLLPALTAAPLLGPNARRGAAVGLENLVDCGYRRDVAVAAYLALIDYVLGTVYFDTSRAAQVDHPRPPPDEVFAFGVSTFLEGLAATCRRER